MPKPWEQREKEPTSWYARFNDLYLLAGPERTLEAAYRKYLQGVREGVGEVHRPSPRRMPGSWQSAVKKYEWVERARAWDQDERKRIRKAHFDNLKKMNERHQVTFRAAFSRAMSAVSAMSFDGLTAPQLIHCLDRLFHLERQAMGEPVGIEITHRGPGQTFETESDEAAQEASADAAKRFEASPEILAQAVAIMNRYEVKDYGLDDGPGGAAATAPADAAPPQPPDQADGREDAAVGHPIHPDGPEQIAPTPPA